MRVFIVGSVNNRYCRQLLECCHNLKILCDIHSFSDISAGVNTQSGNVSIGEHRVASGDLVLVRAMPLGSLEQIIFRMDALWAAQQNGARVVNNAKALEAAIDKYLSLVRLQQAGLPVPSTFVCQSAAMAMDWFEANQMDVVVKPLFGGEGRGIFRVSDTDLAWRSFRALERTGATIMLQEFLDHQNQDFRILMFGERRFSIVRKNANDWRTNVSRGAVAESCQLTEKQLSIAERAKSVLGLDFAGVDLVSDCNGRDFVLEVNAVPGWDGVAKATKANIAEEFAKWALRTN